MNDMTELFRQKAQEALPPVEGDLRLGGIREPVEVIRDRWGVPHIYAHNTHDLYFAQGFVMASERLFQLELTFRLATGRLSEAFGELTLPLDRFVRTAGWNRAGRRLARQYDDLSMEMVRATVEGTRAWVEHMRAAPVEYQILGLEPSFEWDHSVDVGAAAAVLMSWTLSTK